jgi:hypothetical protein
MQKVMAHLHIDRRRLLRLRPPDSEMPVETFPPVLNYDPINAFVAEYVFRPARILWEQGISTLPGGATAIKFLSMVTGRNASLVLSVRPGVRWWH